MEWDVPEYRHQEKTNDWYASVILIVGALIAVMFLIHNYLLATLVFVGVTAFLLMAARRPEVIHVAIGPTGVRSGNVLYHYDHLDGFNIIEYTHDNRLVLESNKHFMPLIVIPLAEEVDVEELRELMTHYLPQKELHESAAHLLFEKLGF